MQIGAVVRLGPIEEGAPPARYGAIRDMARRIEDSGLDSVWAYDHLLYRWPGQSTDGIWECWTILSALAEATQRVRIGTLVLCTPFRNPALLAKMAVTLDEISAGRLILGVGAGWHQPEFDAFGVPFDHRVSRFEEALRIIRPLLRDGRADVEGVYYSASDCEIIPSGPRPGGPPLMVAGKGPRMLRLTAGYADSWNTAWHAKPADAVPRIEAVRAACTAAGREPTTLGITTGLPLVYPDLGPASMPNSLQGTHEHIAETLAGFANVGVSHVIVDISPHTPAALARFAAAVRLYRASH
ncbi:MAG: LLM class flavin-dependent oxidoreductase [Chloroflexota bacterium]